MNKTLITTISVGAGGLLVGLGVGYGVGKARTAKTYEAIIDKELQDLKDHYARPKPVIVDEDTNGETPIYDELVQINAEETARKTPPTDEELAGNDAIIESQGYKDHGASLKDRVVDSGTHNIFVDGVPLDPDAHDGNTLRDPSQERPYIISHLLWHEHDPNIEKISMTYYEGDDTLAYDDDTSVDDVSYLIGDDVFAHFGEMSGDKDIVYVRNEALQKDFEVVRDGNSYAAAVGGILPPKEPQRRMREGDDQ